MKTKKGHDAQLKNQVALRTRDVVYLKYIILSGKAAVV
jgi:hypothetical protein